MRDIIEQVSSCEWMTDRLITQLKDAQQERERECLAFERILARIQDELTRAKNDLDRGRTGPDRSPEREIDLNGDQAPLAVVSAMAAP